MQPSSGASSRSCGGSNTTRRGSARRNTDCSKCVKRERELVLIEVRWLEILAADILKESVPRSVLANSVWAIIARFKIKSLQTRAQAEVATARARAASQVVVLQ